MGIPKSGFFDPLIEKTLKLGYDEFFPKAHVVRQTINLSMLALMTKPFLILILFFLGQNSFCQNLNPGLLKAALSQLEIEEDKCFISLVSSLNISNEETILVIPEIEEAEERAAVLNSHILIVSTSTGAIKSSFYKQKAWYTDAVRINSINISYQPYQLSPTLSSIGITIDYEGSSRVNPIGVEELSLYVRNGEEIEVLLENFVVHNSIGDRIALEAVDFEVHKKFIKLSSSLTNGYFDLVVMDSVTNYQFLDGEEKNINKKLETEVFKFENGEYRKVQD